MSILVPNRHPSQLSLRISFGASLLLLVGCGASEPPPLGTLDPNSTTFPGVSVTSSGAGGSGGTGMTGACVPEAPPSAHISDFADWTSTMNWGASGALKGDSFKYNGENTTVWAYELDVAAQNMHVTGTSMDYGGFGMAFDTCVDATAFTGIQFDLWGTSVSTVFQIQTAEDQNMEYGDPRAVCDVAVSGECAIPASRIQTVSAEQTTVQLPFAEFSGGVPVPTVSTNQLLGLQWQFECGNAEGCPVDVRIDNVSFY